jgi:hypothetical protein
MAGRSYAVRSLAVRRCLGLVLLPVLLGITACGSSSPTKGEQAKSIAEQAGLPADVAAFFSLATAGTTATYRSTLETTDASSKPLQVTTTQRPPDTRVDVFQADGTIDSTISIDGRSYQCSMAAGQWQCGELGTSQSTSSQVFGPDTVQRAVDTFRQRATDYDFRVEDRQIANTAARCLVTSRKPDRTEDPSLGASATMCLSSEGAVLLVEVPSGSVTATAYSTTIPPDAFTLPAPVSPSSSEAPTTTN